MPNKMCRVDANQPELVANLRKMGYSVAVTSTLGGGFGDIVVGVFGINLMFEIKDPAQPKSKRALTTDEERFHRDWKGQISVVETVEDVLAAVRQAMP